MRSALVTILCMLAPAMALAHPGHGHTQPEGWMHYVTEPVHLLALAGSGALVVITTVAWQRSRHHRRTRRRIP